MFAGADDRRFKGSDEDSDEFREYAVGGGGSIEDVCADLDDLVIVGEGADPMLLELRTIRPAEGEGGTEPFMVERDSVRMTERLSCRVYKATALFRFSWSLSTTSG
jgi:hypothetical protein